MPKKPSKDLYNRLILQCQQLGINIMEQLPIDTMETQYDLVLDAIFGFSFSGDVRAPFDLILKRLNECKLPIVSVDVPSGM